MNFTKHRLLFLFHFMVQHNNIQHLRLLEFSMARSLPIGFFASCLHITSILSTCRALILMSPTCAQSRLVFQSPWPMSQRERISHLVYDFDASSIVWSFDTIEMADWFKDGWRRWLKEVTLQHSNGVLLFYTSITSPPKFVVLLVLDWSLELLN